MANTIQHKRSSTAGHTPTLVAGEIAINDADGLLFWRDSGGTVRSKSLAKSRDEIRITLDGGGAALAVGAAGVNLPIGVAGTIVAWYLSSKESGSVVLDVWKASGAIPTNANSIAGTEKPQLSSAQLASDTSLTTWTTALAAGDVLEIEVESATVTRAVLVLVVERP